MRRRKKEERIVGIVGIVGIMGFAEVHLGYTFLG